MDEKEDILIKNAKEFYQNAIGLEKSESYNSAVTLFFKSLAVLGDIFILRNEKKIPSSHSERFRILEEKHPDVYNLLDKDFPFYQNSYKLQLDKETCEVLKKDVEKLIKLLGITL